MSLSSRKLIMTRHVLSLTYIQRWAHPLEEAYLMKRTQAHFLRKSLQCTYYFFLCTSYFFWVYNVVWSHCSDPPKSDPVDSPMVLASRCLVRSCSIFDLQCRVSVWVDGFRTLCGWLCMEDLQLRFGLWLRVLVLLAPFASICQSPSVFANFIWLEDGLVTFF